MNIKCPCCKGTIPLVEFLASQLHFRESTTNPGPKWVLRGDLASKALHVEIIMDLMGAMGKAEGEAAYRQALKDAEVLKEQEAGQ